ncbi:MAG TPA: FapA family protein [Treponemataceae bacterium]|nr:FapA family protein [Treponemataceae bacterium]
MVTLDMIRNDMEIDLEQNQAIRYVDVGADSIDEALSDAAVQLDSRVSQLEYEILEKGNNGVLGFAKKPWLLRVYENEAATAKRKKESKKDSFFEDSFEEEVEKIDRDGLFYIRYFGEDIHLKVLLPIGDGKPVDAKEILHRLQRSDTLSVNDSLVTKLVKNGTEEKYIAIGKYKHSTAADALILVDIANDEMKASITVTPPAVGGSEVHADQIETLLMNRGIVAGIDREKIEEFVDNPIYNVPCVVAEAIQPVDGRDAYIAYNFETDSSKLRFKEAEDGRVDFKEHNLIQNVVEGQPLAQKMLAEQGKAGKTILGRYLEAKNGKDINLPLGKNVIVDSDGRTILAATNGQVLLIGDKINVEPVMQIAGNVSIKTGNITFLGTVIVKGNVDDGFNIKASGNIEVYGTVGKSILEADGDIVVSQGILGRDEGYVRAGRSLWAKFIQNTKVDVEEYIIVAEGIVNSQVTSNKKILVQGKRASIMGGHVFATEEIYTKNLGSPGGGSETIIEVGYDPRSKRRLTELQEKQAVLIRELDEIELNLQTLENTKKVRKTLPHDKEESLVKFTARKEEILVESEAMSAEIQQIQQYLRDLKVIGKVSAMGTVYAGVKIHVRDAKDDVRTEVKAVTFFYEDGFVRRGKYEAPSDDDTKRVPDGYSSN